ncbi:hypothetical protein GQ53DRAFT_817783 [Thozetella sp. PMI_491]|nr:hypothetical protein GQ53DRAFT_817783 [Thozetella sp. PMI_491]
MKFLPATLFVLTLSSGASAANCLPTSADNYDDGDAWAVRQTLCTGGGSCQRAMGTAHHHTYICSAQQGQAYAAFRSPTKANAMAHCWDAFENIINQCARGGRVGGTWNWKHTLYSLESVSTNP